MSKKVLIHKRGFIRKKVTENFNCRNAFSTYDHARRSKLKLSFQNWQKELSELDSQIFELLYSEWQPEEVDRKSEIELESTQEYLDKIFECISLLDIKPTTVVNQASSSVDSNSLSQARSLLRSPVAPLPTYSSGEDEDLQRFFTEFESTINKHNYSDYDKLLLLKQQVSGRALSLIKSIEPENLGYSSAKELLMSALASPETVKFNILKKLTNLKMPDHSDPFEFVSQVRVTIDRVRKQNIDIDTVLQYFVWTSMNDDFRDQLTLITNKTKPSITEISDNIFAASDRYLTKVKIKNKTNDKSNEKQNFKSNSLAANVSYEKKENKDNFKPCTLCTDVKSTVPHPIFRCERFKSAKEKCGKLETLNGCTRCSNLNHRTEVCRYKFSSRCRQCQGWHFSFLCWKPASPRESKPLKVDESTSDTQISGSSPDCKEKVVEPNSNPKTKSKSQNKNSNKVNSSSMVTITDAFQSYLEDEILLPTFTFDIESSTYRGLKDGGCQWNFITNKLANDLNLKVVKK